MALDVAHDAATSANDSGPGVMPGPCKMGCDWLSIGARQKISYDGACGNRWLSAMWAAMMPGCKSDVAMPCLNVATMLVLR